MMHIPDGFLDVPTSILTYAVFLAYFGYTLHKLNYKDVLEKTSLTSVIAACIFAAQMLNWPIPGGTSLHFVGGALAGILLGPWLGFLAMFLVLLVQCLIFHDGGITALGANAINMAVINVLVGYVIYRVLLRFFGRKNSVRAIAGFLGGWLGITFAGIACGIEIGISKQFVYGLNVTVPIMGGWHAILGVIEGIITSLTILYIAKVSPNLIACEGGR